MSHPACRDAFAAAGGGERGMMDADIAAIRKRVHDRLCVVREANGDTRETLMRLEGQATGDDGVTREATLQKRIAELEGAMRHAVKIEIALKVIIGHWDEFGPEHDFAETIEIARRVVRK